MTNHIVARQWTGAVLGEQPEVSEIFHDPVKQCFGVYGGPAVGVLWYPHLTPTRMLMHEQQKLSGKVISDHSENDLVFDFSVKDQIQIVQFSTGIVLASFSVNGFFASAGTTMGSVKFNFLNLLINSSLARIRRTDEVLLPTGNWGIGANDVASQYMIAPNWLLWQLPGAGNLIAGLNDTDLPPNVGCRYGVMVTTSPTLPGASALRTFIHKTDDLIGETINASVWTKSPNGAVHVMRLVTPDYLLAAQVVTGTGNWQRVSFTATIPAGSVRANNWLSFDMFSNPGNISTLYQFAKPQITVGAGLLPEERRSGEMESILVNSIFWEGKANIFFNQPQYQQFNISFDDFLYLEGVCPTFGGGSFSNVTIDSLGATYQWNVGNDNGQQHQIWLTAYRAPNVIN